MVDSERRTKELLRVRQLRSSKLFVGVDGGGTKTHAVVVDDSDRVLGEGTTGPSNPLRVGITSAAAAIREAVERACNAAQVRRTDIVAAEVCSDLEVMPATDPAEVIHELVLSDVASLGKEKIVSTKRS